MGSTKFLIGIVCIGIVEFEESTRSIRAMTKASLRTEEKEASEP